MLNDKIGAGVVESYAANRADRELHTAFIARKTYVSRKRKSRHDPKCPTASVVA